MNPQGDLGAGLGKRLKGRDRNHNVVAHAGRVDDDLVGMFFKQLAAQEGDHLSGLLCVIPKRGGASSRQIVWCARQWERESRALAKLGLHPDGSSMPVHDLLANGQSNSGSGIFAAVQALEDAKDLGLMLGLN